MSVPTLVMRGDDVPYADLAPLSPKLLKTGILKAYRGSPHCMPTAEAATINADQLAFIRSKRIPMKSAPLGSSSVSRYGVSVTQNADISALDQREFALRSRSWQRHMAGPAKPK
jgi:hypothetical protein